MSITQSVVTLFSRPIMLRAQAQQLHRLMMMIALLVQASSMSLQAVEITLPQRYNKILNHQTAQGSDVFLTAGVPNAGANSLVRVVTAYNTAVNPPAASLLAQPYAIQNPTIINGNPAPKNDSGGPLFVSPLYNVPPSVATMFGDYIATVVGTGNVFLVPTATSSQLITTTPLGNVIAGTAANPPTINFNSPFDAAGYPTGSIAALATGDALYAAVGSAGAGTFWGGNDNRGIARLTVTGNTLMQTPLNPASPNDNFATPLALAAVDATANPENVIATFNSGAGMVTGLLGARGVNPGVVMHYDTTLQRLFVGLKGLLQNAAGNAGGLVGVLVGQPNAANDGTIDLRSVFHNPVQGVFDAAVAEENRYDRVLAIFKNAAGDPAVPDDQRIAPGDRAMVSIHQLKTMNTSTGRTYLIVASEVGASNAVGRRASGLYFVPIMGKTAFDPAGLPSNPALPEQIGKVATADFRAILSGAVLAAGPNNVEQLDVVPSRGALPLAGLNCISNTVELLANATSRVRSVPLLAARRGAGSTYVSDLEVLGDTVLVSVSSASRDGQDAFRGVYQSTAIFSPAGNIVAWTPLQRVDGVSTSASAVAVDTVMGATMYLDSTGRTFHRADWAANTDSITGAVLHDAVYDLKQLINSNFPASQGGVRAIQAFDAATPTFAGGLVPVPPAPAPIFNQQCALLVVLGYNKVMVVQTVYNNYIARHFRSTPAGGPATFGGPAANDIQNVFIFDATTNPGLDAIAPLTCAEVLKIVRRDDNVFDGFLYVGGYNGVCRLEAAGHVGWQINSIAGGNFVTGLRNANDFFVAANPSFIKLNNQILKDVRRLVSTIGIRAPIDDPDSTSLVAILADGYVVATGEDNNLNFTAGGLRKQVPAPNHGPIFDGVLVRDINAPVPVPPFIGGFGAALGAAQSYLILATQDGLWVRDVPAANPAALVTLDDGDLPIQLAYVPLNRGGVTGGGTGAPQINAGMLYVLAGSQADGDIRIHRFAVTYAPAAADVLKPLGAPVSVGNPKTALFDVTTFRRYFGTDGLQFLFGNDSALDTPEMLNQMLLSSLSAAPLPLTSVLGRVSLGDFTSPALREPVTGAWMVGGSVGLAVNN